MNIVLAHRTTYRDRKRSNEFLEALPALVETEADGRKRELLRSLSRLLLVPDSPLSSFPVADCFSLARSALELMDRRQEDFAVMRWRPRSEKCAALLIDVPDAPFVATFLQLLESIRNGALKLMAYLPLSVHRDGERIARLAVAEPASTREVLIVIRLDGGEAAEQSVRDMLAASLRASHDEKALQARLDRLCAVQIPKPCLELLDWLRTGVFLPFSYRRWIIAEDDARNESAKERLGIVQLGDTVLGQLFGNAQGELLTSRESPFVLKQTCQPGPLYHAERVTRIGCRETLSNGTVLEHEFLGLFSARAMEEPALAVPALRKKIMRILTSLSVAPDSYDFKRAADLFNAFPKVELFLTDDEQLHLIARSVLHVSAMHEQFKLLLLASPNPEVFVLLGLQPRNLFQEKNIPAFEHWLLGQMSASLECTRVIQRGSEYIGLYWTFVPEAEQIRLDLEHLEKGLVRLTQPWEQRFRALLRRIAGNDGMALADKYVAALPPGYRELTPPGLAVRDILQVQKAVESKTDRLELFNPIRSFSEHHNLLRIYSSQERFLDELLPFLENLGLRVADQVQFAIQLEDSRWFIKSFLVRSTRENTLPLMDLKKQLLEMLEDLLAGRVENDGLNELLLLTGLGWRDIDVFRGYRNYYLQLGIRFTRERFHEALLHHPNIALLQHRYFKARFDPDQTAPSAAGNAEDMAASLQMDIAAALDAISDLSEDRILRDLFNLIDATVRTNYFLRRGCADYFFAFKVCSLGVLNMPAPIPLFEIYVHSADMEGIHLRGAKVARGGIRWSERPDDFRSEILDLMQTQAIKNAQIVPHGAKGGFIIKNPYSSRAEALRLVDEAYATLIRGLLDLTDNIGEKGVVRLPEVVSYDDDGPYLVVAADKGTAHLSDSANAISKEYGFWLGDAFASGGSHGYDHKKLGITARGAWECVKRHFRELGHDIQTQSFSVVGIGSMDGDVFGNAMLLSPAIRLRAAFGAKHIFLDPDPDAELSYRERKRLFELQGSSWDNYDRKLISPGGGVFGRTAKDIPLSPAVRQWLGVHYSSIDGEHLIRLLLSASVDLLWLGGIGTYVKASQETNEEVGDRSNDAVRVDAGQLRAKVVGEGANLGFTQKARIEFALAGGMVNIDAIDNSGGVDLSDHEVNLKILMAALESKGIVTGEEQRNLWLREVTDEVCASVLANNKRQSLCLSLDQLRCQPDIEPFLETADHLENAGLLDRVSESFPPRKDVLVREGKGLTRPELAVLMLYSKLAFKRALLEAPDFLSSHSLGPWLEGYFPERIRKQFATYLGEHSLAREITATVLTNAIINQAGCGFLALAKEVGTVSVINAAGAYLAFDEIIRGQPLRTAIDALENIISAERQYHYLIRIERLLVDYCRWALEYGQTFTQDAEAVRIWSACFEEYLGFLTQHMTAAEREVFEEATAGLKQEGFESRTAHFMALTDRLSDFPTLSDLAVRSNVPLAEAAQRYRAIVEYLGFGQIERQLDGLMARDHWERRMQTLLKGRFRFNLARLARAFLESGHNNPEPFLIACGKRWRLERFQRLHREVIEASMVSAQPFSVLCAELDGLADFCLSDSMRRERIRIGSTIALIDGANLKYL